MRRVTYALILLSLASPAAAADLDFDFLRGSETVGPGTYTRWNGFYVGGQIGYTNGNADFSNSTQSGVSYALRQTDLELEFAPSSWQVLGTANNSAASFGGFIGYNTQWEDAIFGVEANINRAGVNLHAQSTPIGPLITAPDAQGDTHTVTMSGTGSIANLDFATLRFRAGYVVGNFMPYAFVGPAFGLANVAVGVTGTNIQCTTSAPSVCANFPFTSTYGLNSAVLYGFTVGGGVDVALTQNIFLRADIEYDNFNPPPGIPLALITGRVGAGLKF